MRTVCTFVLMTLICSCGQTPNVESVGGQVRYNEHEVGGQVMYYPNSIKCPNCGKEGKAQKLKGMEGGYKYRQRRQEIGASAKVNFYAQCSQCGHDWKP